jgi:hypothetical protein
MTKFAGRTLTVDIGGSPAGQMTSLAPFGSKRNLVDASVYGEEWTDFVLGLKDGDEVAATFAFDPGDTGQDAIITAYEDNPDTPVTRLPARCSTSRVCSPRSRGIHRWTVCSS